MTYSVNEMYFAPSVYLLNKCLLEVSGVYKLLSDVVLW